MLSKKSEKNHCLSPKRTSGMSVDTQSNRVQMARGRVLRLAVGTHFHSTNKNFQEPRKKNATNYSRRYMSRRRQELNLHANTMILTHVLCVATGCSLELPKTPSLKPPKRRTQHLRCSNACGELLEVDVNRSFIWVWLF